MDRCMRTKETDRCSVQVQRLTDGFEKCQKDEQQIEIFITRVDRID
jgi:hypothetical protein